MVPEGLLGRVLASSLLIAMVVGIGLAWLGGPAAAQSDVLINGGFEREVLADRTWGFVTVPGWTTSRAGNDIEVWAGGFANVPATEGRQIVQLNGSGPDSITQTVAARAGMVYEWSIDHRAHHGVDDTIEVIIDGVSQGQFTLSERAWKTHSGFYRATGDELTITFQAIDPGGSSNLIDNARLVESQQLLANGGFEREVLADRTWGFVTVPGWTTSRAGNDIEVWAGGFANVPATEGRQIVQLNGSRPDSITQTVPVSAGTVYEWSIDHRAHHGVDDTIEVIIDGVSQGEYSVAERAWKTHSGLYRATGDELTITFQAIDPGGASNLIDNARLVESPGRLLANGGFEWEAIDGPAWSFAALPGWTTSRANDHVEVWADGFGGVSASEGRQIVELNGYGPDSITQTVPVSAGTVYEWGIDHRASNGVDDTIEVIIDGVSQGEYSVTERAWKTHSGLYTATGDELTITFQAIDPGSASNLVDNTYLVALSPQPVSTPTVVPATPTSTPLESPTPLPGGDDGLVCSSDAGMLNWSDEEVGKYWVYKSVDGAPFSWLGRTLGSTFFVDPTPVVGARYQVHYANTPRVDCTIVSEPDASAERFSCETNNGVIAWSDAGQSKYWLYRSVDGGVTNKWLGRSLGGTVFVDPNPVSDARYQVHFAGTPRTDCSATDEPLALPTATPLPTATATPMPTATPIPQGFTLHADASFGGVEQVFGPGVYSGSTDFSTVGNDSASSLSVMPGYIAVVCGNTNATGTCRGFTRSKANLSEFSLNNTISYVQVRRLGEPIVLAPGNDVKQLVNRLPAGTEFVFTPGVYSGQALIAKNDMSFVGQPGAILDGNGIASPAISGIGHRVTIRGLEIRNYRPGDYTAAVQARNPANFSQDGEGWLVEGNEIHSNYAIGINVASDMTIRDNNIHDNVQMGISGIGNLDNRMSNITIDGNDIVANGATYTDTFRYHEGGIKILYTTGLTVKNNNINGNFGTQIYCDMYCVDLLVENNDIVMKQGRRYTVGVVLELQRDATVRNNRITSPPDVVGSAVRIMEAHDVVFENNLIHIGYDGVGGDIFGVSYEWGMATRDGSGRPVGENITLRSNTIYANQGLVKIGTSTGIQPSVRYEGNQYHESGGDIEFRYKGSVKSWAEWRALGYDTNGSCCG